ncbi:MAG: DUF1211 domain-containing protein [Planctomycetota bacterium]|nr:MAG: DUF1211 domain-containing protein [Planctomycetota bacterium]
MNKGRLETFCDGVIAIIITIMVLEMKAPQDAGLDALCPVWPAFASYVLSFIYVGIYWNNHHHLFQTVHRVSGPALWASLHWLFWLSLIPFVTRWMGATQFATWPVAIYGVVMLMCGAAWDLTRRVLLCSHNADSDLARAMMGHAKESASLALYAIAIGLAFVNVWLACALYGLVAAIWIIPDRRIERAINTPVSRPPLRSNLNDSEGK